MKSLKPTLLFLIILSFSVHINAQQGNKSFPKAIISATGSANVESLSTYLSDKIELALPEKSGIFTKSQAKIVLKNFFSAHAPISFQIIHQGERENSSFAIGKYKSNGKTFRFYFLTKQEGSKILIHQLRIEKQDD